MMNRIAAFMAVVVSIPVAIALGSTVAQEKKIVESRPAANNKDIEKLPELKTLNGYFPFKPPQTLDEWKVRRRKLKQHLQVSLGLWPMPVKTPLKTVIHGKIDMGEYTIEKVYFQSFPGFFVTGNLYRPKDTNGKKLPAILSPHGHWAGGRFMWASDKEVKAQIAAGAEKFESNARSPLQARCANLARMGCAVFHYDMIGYADCMQISRELAHGFRKQRPEMNKKDAWGFFSPQAELRLQSIMGLQTWNSIRSLDFLCSLPDVDSKRIGVTGASGGGTQTFILCAIDPRPAAAFPAVMVSTAMQGGCTCENCCNLRINSGNVEIAALFAPKPLGLTAANDWTREMEKKGFPELRSLFRFYAPQPLQGSNWQEKLVLLSRVEFGHNYNQVSRATMYGFFNAHLRVENSEFKETKIKVLNKDSLTVFDAAHKRPHWSKEREIELLKHWEKTTTEPLSSQDQFLYEDQIKRACAIVRPAIESMISHPSSTTEFKVNNSGMLLEGILRAGESGQKSKIAYVVDRKIDDDESGVNDIAIFLKSGGIQTLHKNLNDFDSLESEFMIKGPNSIATLDLIGDNDSSPMSKNRLVANGREAAGYTFGYNRSLLAQRVSQVINLVNFLETKYPDRKLWLFADKKYAPVAAVAFSVSKSKNLGGLAADLNGFRFVDVTSFQYPNFLPGGAKYLDIEGMLMLQAGREIHLGGENEDSMPRLRNAQSAFGNSPNLSIEAELIFGQK